MQELHILENMYKSTLFLQLNFENACNLKVWFAFLNNACLNTIVLHCTINYLKIFRTSCTSKLRAVSMLYMFLSVNIYFSSPIC